MEYRIEHDSMGEMKVPADCLKEIINAIKI